MRWCRSVRLRLGAPPKLLNGLLLCFFALASAAQENPRDLTEASLEELMNIQVYSASKYTQTVSEAPSSVSVITADEIQKYGYRTLADILRSLRGFSVNYGRDYSYLGVRGFQRSGDYNTRILVLIDGHRISDDIWNTAMLGTEFPLDVDLIERVEVIRGPSSSLYGTSAFFAVINVITRRGRDVKGVELSFEPASFGTYRGRFTYGNQFKGVEWLLSGTFYDSQGQNLYFPEFDSPATSHGVAVGADYDRYHDLFTSFSWRDFTLQGLYSQREKGLPAGYYGTVFNDTRTLYADGRRYVDVRYEHTFAGEWGVVARVYYDHYPYDGDYIYNYGTESAPQLVLYKDFSREAWWGEEVRLAKTVLRKHKLIAGSEFRHNVRLELGSYDVDPYFLYFADSRSPKTWAFYGQDEFTITGWLTLNAGIRHDHYESFGGTTNPRLGLIVRPRAGTAVKLLYGSAFRAPNHYELFYNGGGLKPNPHLQPETIHSTEVALEQAVGQHWRLTGSVFYNRMDDLISQSVDPADGLLMFKNGESASVKGLELEVAGQTVRGLQGRASYTVQKASALDRNLDLITSPRQLAKLNLTVPLVGKKLVAGLEGQYTARRMAPGGMLLGGYPVVNATLLGRNLGKGFDVSASIYNLFDKRYADPGSDPGGVPAIQQDGRNFRLKFTYRFGGRK